MSYFVMDIKDTTLVIKISTDMHAVSMGHFAELFGYRYQLAEERTKTGYQYKIPIDEEEWLMLVDLLKMMKDRHPVNIEINFN